MLNCPTCEFADFNKDKCKRLLTRLPHICPYAVERKPRNNFEEVKAMSMEQMAEFLHDFAMCENTSLVWIEEWLKEAIADG